jgi:sortase A
MGLLLVFAYVVVRIYSVVYAHATVREFWRNQEATINRPGNLLQQNLGIPDFRLWSPKRVEAYQTSVTTNIPAPLGVLRIPSIEIEVPVLEGTDDLTLNRAVGALLTAQRIRAKRGTLGSPDTGTDFSAGSRTFTSASTWICTLNGETRVTSWTTSASFHRRTFQYLRHAQDLPSHS